MKTVLLSFVFIILSKLVVGGNIGLFIIDVQNCFIDTYPNATLPVTGGAGVIPVINNIRTNYGKLFSIVVRSQDWHCPHHVSFASSYSGYGRGVFSSVILTYSNETGSPALCRNITGYNNTGFPQNISNEINCTQVNWSIPQTLWPDHCIINTTDAQFGAGQITNSSDFIVQKGFKCWVDSYSAMYDNGHFTATALPGILQSNPISTAIVLGLAFDYCVFYTAMDLQAAGIQTYVIVDGTRYIDPSTNMTATNSMLTAGVKLINYADICKHITCPNSTSSSTGGGGGFSIAPSSLLLVSIAFITTLLLKD